MSTNHDRPKVIPLRAIAEPPASGVPRRVALQALLSGVGAGFVVPSSLDARHPMSRHLSSPAVIEQAQKAAATASTPEFLDAHQAKTLEALAEAIVPGSTAAKVTPFLDRLLAVESDKNQRAFLGALGAFDMAAVTKYGKPWIAIAASEQDALLREASTAVATVSPLRGHFENLKEWVVGAYYSSEVGMRELGWTGNVFHQELPGCTHADGHQD